MGYSTLVVPDHLTPTLSPMPALTAAAMATTSLRVGTLVANNDFRHPVLLAKEAATIDVLSGGRFELGIGAGWKVEDYDQSGIGLDPPGRRIARLEESLQVIRGCLNGDVVNFTGDHYIVDSYEGFPSPVQRPLPILVGAGGPKALAVAARHADIVQLNFQLHGRGAQPGSGSGTAAAAKCATIRDHAGDRISDIELGTAIFSAIITDDAHGAAARLAPTLGMSADEVLRSPHCALGTVNEIADKLRRDRQTLGISYVSCCFGTYEAMAPVVEILADS